MSPSSIRLRSGLRWKYYTRWIIIYAIAEGLEKQKGKKVGVVGPGADLDEYLKRLDPQTPISEIAEIGLATGKDSEVSAPVIKKATK